MILNVKPVASLKGAINLPASKSYSIRSFFIAACGGRSVITAPSDCDDAVVSMNVAKALGCTITQKGTAWHVSASGGISSFKRFQVMESGTSLRFLLPLLSLHTRNATVAGKGTLVGRPNHFLCESLRAQGMDIAGDGASESVPITYRGGIIKPGDIRIDGSLSSQFISALLITLPRLQQDSRVIITGKDIVSSDYIVMTRQILKKAGIAVAVKGTHELKVKGGQKFRGLKFTVPSDYGLAAFPMAAAALVPSNVVLNGHFNDAFIQSDGHILRFLKRMGVKFTRTGSAITMRGPFALKGGTFSLKECPDLVPIMSVLAMFAKGKTSLVDIHHARAKESDRISDLRKELLKVGAKVRETAGTLTIDPQPVYTSGQTLDPHNDHRLAMAFCVLGLKIGCRIPNMECTHKSYPAFVKDMKTLGLQ